MANKGKFELRRATNKEYYFVLKAKNGKVLLTSETYKRKSGVVNGIKSIVETVNDIQDSSFTKGNYFDWLGYVQELHAKQDQ